MKTINVALTEKAYNVLKALTTTEKKNQSDIICELLETQGSERLEKTNVKKKNGDGET